MGPTYSLATNFQLDPALRDRLLSHVTLAGGLRDDLVVRAPYTGELLVRLPAAIGEDVELAVSRARAAQPAWAGLSFARRAEIFLRFHDLLLQRQNEVLDLIQIENGKARRNAFEEVLDAAVVARHYARRAGAYLRPRRRRGALPVLTKTWERRVPHGVAGFVSPWNFPLTLSMTDATAAMLAGNCVILKPDHQTSLTALWAVALLREAGLPRDVAQVVTGDGRQIGPLLIQRVDYIMFTGSTRTGRVVAHEAAERLIRYSLELGGKNPLIVLPDADLERTVDGAVRGCFVGAGQVCVSIERIYVHESLFERFVNRFAERTRAVRLGAELDYGVEMGSLTNAAQLATVSAHVQDALDKGATLVAGGRARPELGPYFYEPTILTGVREGMKLYAEETFGPVVAVYPFRSEDEVVERANDSRFGLSASIWTRSHSRGLRLARRLQSGSVNINEGYAAAWGSVDSPIGGMKESGMIPRHGREGILKFTESQTVALQQLLPIAPPRWMDPGLHARVMSFLLKVLRRIRFLG